jgi:hypothetical protein
MIENPISVAEAAQRISTLINSKSSSPRLAELEAIIAKVSAPVAEGSPSREHIEYRAVAAPVVAWNDETGDEAELERLIEREGEFAERIWARPVETWFDAFLLAEVALHHENGILDCLNEPVCCYDEMALAKLLQAVIKLGRRQHG